MILHDLGYNSDLDKYRLENNIDIDEIGRVIAEHKDNYIVKTNLGEFEAEITGNMRFSARTREDLPAVGDWVEVKPYERNFAIILKIFPRFSVISRKSNRNFGEMQIIAANIDYAFLVQAVDQDFNRNRLERYLAICYSSKVEPIIVLTKTDLINEHSLLEIKESIKNRTKDISIISVSNETKSGYDELKAIIQKGKTYCMLGSSGVGKSTLTNNLSDKNAMRTDRISVSTGKGRHVTSHRELVSIAGSGVLIDNPGLREVGVGDNSSGVNLVFNQIAELTQNCKFKDCTHTNELGCAVLDAVLNGKIDKELYDNYMKITKEITHFETDAAEKRKKEKSFGKVKKSYKKLNIKQRKH